MGTKKSLSNPNGANQYVADPRQELFLSYYVNPKSTSFSNAYESAIRAGFTETYAKVITGDMPDWLSESLRSMSMTRKAERNLDKILDLETKEPVVTMIGTLKDKEGNVITKENANLLRVKADVSKFVAEKLDRKRYGKEEGPQGTVTNNVTQIIINPPQENERKIVTDQSHS